jgi:hypothetical protein
MQNAFVAVLMLAGGAMAAAQDRKPDTPPPPTVITVDGCLRGSTLEIVDRRNATHDGGVLSASEFSLEGSKELLQMLKGTHQGHRMEITGEVKVPPRPANEKVEVKTTDLGRAGRVTIGTRQHAGHIQTPPQPIRLIVQAFEHVSDKCLVGG